MKNIKIILLALSLIALSSISSCQKDDTSQNQYQCNYSGLTFVDTDQNIHTPIPEVELETELFLNSAGGTPTIEIIHKNNPGQTGMLTKATTVGAIDATSTIGFNGTFYTCTITCLREATAVGEDYQFKIVIPSLSNAEAELCVVLDKLVL